MQLAATILDGGAFVGVIGLWLGLAAIATFVWVIISMTADAIAHRRHRNEVRTISRAPRLYAGCAECRAAESMGLTYLIRHQERDHAGGITW